MAINIFICDDEQNIRELLKGFLLKISEDLKESFKLSLYDSAEALLAAPEKADILLLDIKMGNTDGMQAARTLRQRGDNVTIIFITTMTQFALQGYEVHAFGFLEKPVEYIKLKDLISDVIEVRNKLRGEKYEIRNGIKLTAVNLNDIIYFESYRHDIRAAVNGEEEQVECSTALGDLELELSKKCFYRCHKSYLINLRNIAKIDTNDIIMSNGQMIPISRYKKKDFLDAFAKYRSGLV